MVRSLLILGTVCLLGTLRLAHGHGFMFEPKARNVVHNSGYCPHCLAAGGPWEVSGGGTLTWPDGVHGICGDKASNRQHEPGGIYGPVGVQATYSPGQVITISVLVSARHGGRFVFRLCPRTEADEACLSQYTLQRADGAGPYTWTYPSGGPAVPASGYSTGTVNSISGEVYSMQYKLPDGVTCSACTLQWWWTTGNSCVVPGTPFAGSSGLCGGGGAYPEEFWNCADISIGGGSAPVNPQPEPQPQPQPEPQPQPRPEPQPQPQPEPQPQPQPEPQPQPQPEAQPQPISEPAPAANPTPDADPAPAQTTPEPTYDRKMNPGAGDNGGQQANGYEPAKDANSFCQTAADGYYPAPAPWNCQYYVSCGAGHGNIMSCAPGTLWDESTKGCVFPYSANCGSRPKP